MQTHSAQPASRFAPVAATHKPFCSCRRTFSRSANAQRVHAVGRNWFAECKQQLAVGTANVLLAGTLLLGSPNGALANQVNLNADPVYGKALVRNLVRNRPAADVFRNIHPLLFPDGASILQHDAKDNMSQALRDLDRCATSFRAGASTVVVDDYPDYERCPALAGSPPRQAIHQ